jgi:hypothetical protein
MASALTRTGWAIALTHRGSATLVMGLGFDLAIVRAYEAVCPKRDRLGCDGEI